MSKPNYDLPAGSIFLQHSDPLQARGIVILFHGLTSITQEVEELAAYLFKQNYSVLAPVLAGHGTTLKDLQQIRTMQWIEQLDQIIDYARQIYLPEKNIYLAGVSFGGLLALVASSRHAGSITASAVASVPLRLRTRWKEQCLSLISLLPESILSLLPFKFYKYSAKCPKPDDAIGYDAHSISAAARMLKIRRLMLRNISKISCPILIMYDPFDVHVHPSAALSIQAQVRSKIAMVKFFAHGDHQLTLGKKSALVLQEIVDFFERKSDD